MVIVNRKTISVIIKKSRRSMRQNIEWHFSK